jgi:hypothetical protein
LSRRRCRSRQSRIHLPPFAHRRIDRVIIRESTNKMRKRAMWENLSIQRWTCAFQSTLSALLLSRLPWCDTWSCGNTTASHLGACQETR